MIAAASSLWYLVGATMFLLDSSHAFHAIIPRMGVVASTGRYSSTCLADTASGTNQVSSPGRVLRPRKLDFDHPQFKNLTLNKTLPPIDSITWKLWLNNMDIAECALNTDYIQGIQNGSLDPNTYGRYTVQDAAYCTHAVSDYKTNICRSISESPDITPFSEARYFGYTKYAESIIKDWHLNGTTAIIPGPAAQHYINFENMVATSHEYHPIYFIIAMIPCEQLWVWLGQTMLPNLESGNLYTFWIKENQSLQSLDGANRLNNFVNDYFDENPKLYDEALAQRVYRGSMVGELNFFLESTNGELISLGDIAA
jgi:thiaminase/transcriptional activator TenA